MSPNKPKLKGAVLIIGSLLWQDYLDTPNDDIRKKWRDNNLMLHDKILVRAPIRYGRFSEKNKIFTMTFSKTVGKRKYGTAYLVPLRRTITSEKDLLVEAIALSEAEGMKGNFFARWGGVLGILFNSDQISKDSEQFLTNVWERKIKKTPFDNLSFKLTSKELPCIKTNGIMDLKWVSAVDRRQTEFVNNFDFLIATVTKPTKYPTVKELAENVKTDNDRYYWVQNFKNGITTFQDSSILNAIL
jgi:hypothetical protein